MRDTLNLELHTSIKHIDAQQWNALNPDDYPFLAYEFLIALENNDCLGMERGWIPHYLIAKDSNDQLIGALPAFLKTHSYGEFVFDWSWAEAYQRHGLHYYPKLIVAAPFTPATGPRLLLREDADTQTIAQLLAGIKQYATEKKLSGVHILFPPHAEAEKLIKYGFLTRSNCQYIWSNNAYTSFDDFLASLISRKRKKINRERRRTQEQGIRFEVLEGAEVTEEQWHVIYQFYCNTYEDKWGFPSLSLEFFLEVARTMPTSILVVLAVLNDCYIATAILFKNQHTLYGRYWGCQEDYHSLHFETCYYQGIEYCIAKGLTRFEPGAQGEHKIARGFVPSFTWSAHWLANPSFQQAIEDFLSREHALIQDHYNQLMAQIPYRNKSP